MPRARFVKEGDAVWMSHLDLMRVLQRSFRRAGLLLAHSQGFTPHPELSLALPLSVGVSSGCEIMDFKLEEGQDTENLRERLNRVLPAGVEIAEVYEGEMKDGDLMVVNELTAYTITVDDAIEFGTVTPSENLLEMMQNVSVEETDADTLHVTCEISAQDPALNPARITEAIARELPDLAPDYSMVRRIATLNEQGEPFR